MIELKHISIGFSDKTVLDDVSFSLPDTGCVVFRGPSGCGKTTLLRVLAGLIEPKTGEIVGLGERKISMVFQEDRLLPWFTAKENIALICKEDTALQMLYAVGLKEETDTLPAALSGGMRRRVSIARALAYSNDILLLDEPFNGLDPELREKMAELIRNHVRLIILVTHDDGDAELLGKTHSFIFTQSGKIVEN